MSETDHGEGRSIGLFAYDAWFRAKVREAQADPRPAIAHADVEAHFAKLRDAVLNAVNERPNELR